MRELVADIPVLFQAAGQWLIRNALLITSLSALLFIVEWILKPCRFIWSRIKRRRKPGTALRSADLRFVPIPTRCRCAIGMYGDQSITQINTHWHVTNPAKTSTPVQLLTARLLKPRVHHPSAQCSVSTARRDRFRDVYSVEHEIPSGETRKVSIGFYVYLNLQRSGRPLRVRFAVMDQLAKEHRMPPILLHVHKLFG